jgi:hypothetical protein
VVTALTQVSPDLLPEECDWEKLSKSSRPEVNLVIHTAYEADKYLILN